MPKTEIEERVEPAARRNGWQRRSVAMRAVQSTLSGSGDWMDGHPGTVLTLLLLLYAAVVLVMVHSHPLWSDEIYTWHIARQPTVRQMLWLAREIDLHPPFHYFLERWALHVPLPRYVSARLPSMLAGGVMLWALFRMSSRRYGTTLAMGAVAAFFMSQTFRYAWDNRPYMILFCALTLLVMVWQRATAEGRRWYDVGLVFLASLAMISDHLIGLACLLPFAVGEVVRLRERRRADWALWLAIFSPMLVGVSLYYQIHHLQMNSFPKSNLASPGVVIGAYLTMGYVLWVAVMSCTATVSMLPLRAERPRAQVRGWHGHELAMLWTLALMPILITILGALLRIQTWQRYSFIAVVAIALLVPWGLGRFLRSPRAAGVLLAVAVVIMAHDWYAEEGMDKEYWSGAFYQTGMYPLFLADLRTDLPIVTGSPMTFTEMSDREPAQVARRTYYLTDRASELRYSGYTLFDNEAKMVRLLGFQTHAVGMEGFLKAHHQFYFLAEYNSAEDWLPRTLLDRGVNLNYLGKFVSSYNDENVYLVTVPDPVPPVPEPTPHEPSRN